MQFKKLISGFLTLTLLISLFPTPNAQAVKRTYPTDGYCTKYTTPQSQGGFGYDRIEVPNPLMSDYLEDLDPNAAVTEMNRIKSDHLCMQRADIEYMLTKITDETRRTQLQRELEDIIESENKIKDKLKLLREREERIAKLLETFRALAKYSNEIGAKNMIDLRSAKLEEFHVIRENNNQKLETQKEERAQKVKAVMTKYNQSTSTEKKEIKAELKTKVQNEYTILKQQIESTKQEITQEITDTLSNHLNEEYRKFDTAIRKEITDTDELGRTLEAYQEFQKEQKESYLMLAEEIINAALVEINQISHNIEKVIGSVELPPQSQSYIPKGILVVMGTDSHNLVQDSPERLTEGVTEKIENTEKMKIYLKSLNILLYSADIRLIKVMNDPQMTETVNRIIEFDNNHVDEKLITVLDDIDAKDEGEISKAYRMTKRKIEFLQKRYEVILSKEESPEVMLERLEEIAAGCYLKPEEFGYEVISINPSPLVFMDGADTATINVTLKNTGTETWRPECKISLIRSKGWKKMKNSNRHERGFTENSIPGFLLQDEKVATVDKIVLPNETIELEFEVGIPPNAERIADHFRLNRRVGNNIFGVYVYAVKKEIRPFRTSISNVRIMSLPIKTAETIQIIPKAGIPVTIIGKAVWGQYHDGYKTKMWYPVEYGGRRGFVVASTVHGEWIKWDPVKCKTTGINKNNKRKDSIILHFTVSNNSLQSELNSMSNCSNGRSSHYVVDREGKLIQPVEDFNAAWHAIPMNYNSIGIEISNWGPLKKDTSGGQEKYYRYGYQKKCWIEKGIKKCGDAIGFTPMPSDQNKIPNNQVIHVPTELKLNWDIWNSSSNHYDQSQGSYEHWQKYSNEQYDTLRKLLKYIEERFDIPNQFYNYKIPQEPLSSNKEYLEKAIYYYPSNIAEKKNYLKKLKSFYGIYGHHNVNGKYDPGPHIDLNQLN